MILEVISVLSTLSRKEKKIKKKNCNPTVKKNNKKTTTKQPLPWLPKSGEVLEVLKITEKSLEPIPDKFHPGRGTHFDRSLVNPDNHTYEFPPHLTQLSLDYGSNRSTWKNPCRKVWAQLWDYHTVLTHAKYKYIFMNVATWIWIQI